MQGKRWIYGLAWTVAFAGFSISAHAAEMKIGYVDIKSAVENATEYQQGIKKLEALKEKKQKELQILRDKINAAEKELMGQSMAMSPDRLAAKQQEIKEMRKDFARQQQDAQEELVSQKNRLDMSVGAKFQQVIRDYGKSGHFDFILPKSTLLYANPKFDITSDITKKLDKK